VGSFRPWDASGHRQLDLTEKLETHNPSEVSNVSNESRVPCPVRKVRTFAELWYKTFDINELMITMASNDHFSGISKVAAKPTSVVTTAFDRCHMDGQEAHLAWPVGGSSVSEIPVTVPHARASCPSYPFDPGVLELCRLYCPNCYCYICGIGVTPRLCPLWLLHCTCTEDEAMSVDYRDVWRDNDRGATVWAPRPHDRADCPLYPFNDDLGYDLTNPGGNMRFCDYCYCFICERRPNLCEHWELHSCATRNNPWHVACQMNWYLNEETEDDEEEDGEEESQRP
jgi:hypothetical protein